MRPWHERRQHWREQSHRWREHKRRMPRPLRRIGCIFATLIVLAAFGAGSVVSMILRGSRDSLPLGALGGLLVLVLVAGFAMSMARIARIFGDQVRLRRQLMADVAHELRTPITILQGRIEGLLDGVYPRDDARLQQLLAETRHLARLVEDVRTIANADAGALDLRKERTDIAALLRDVASAIGERVTLDVPPDLPSIEVDPLRLREVLLNLLHNAVQHAGDSAITLAATHNTKRITIRVIDRGRGIPADELPHLFERFRKGASSGGSGLGLAIARKLVVAHGGEISVDSSAGAGTTVTVTLPR